MNWPHLTIGLVVTGDAEERSLPDLLRELTRLGTCHFEVIRKVDQRAAIGKKRTFAYGVQGKTIPDRDAEIAGFIRNWLSGSDNRRAVWIDDLERLNRADSSRKFERLKNALQTMLSKESRLVSKASVHFLVNMLEAYFFADVNAISHVFPELNLARHDGDVENISHPKNTLAKLIKKQIGKNRGYRETDDAVEIVRHLNLETVLAEPDQCRSLRTLVAWCWEQIGQGRTDRFQLKDGAYWEVTAGQLRVCPTRVEPLGVETSYQPVKS